MEHIRKFYIVYYKISPMISIENQSLITKLGKLKDLPKNPLVSIIIPAYNEEKFVWQAIESLLKQTYKPIEIIIVDNASIDSTVKIVERYEKHGIKLIKNEKNEGYGGGCNVGFKLAKGQILMFWDADHIYGENYVKELIGPILEGKDVCTLHNEEKIANLDNLWARAFGQRICTKNGRGKLFSLIRRDIFLKFGPYDPIYGYADDQTLFIKHGITSLGANTEIYHFNPDSLKVNWKHGKWVGKSYPHPCKVILILPAFPVYVLYKSFTQFIKDPYWKFIYFLPVYNTIKYFSYFFGAIDRIKGKKRIED